MTSSQRPALGRGLSALIPKSGGGSSTIDTVDIDLIAPNPRQPRVNFDRASLDELAASIREHGVLQPVVVTRTTSELGVATYQLIAGERRLQAARIAGLERIPVVLKDASDAELLEIALVENLQREDLNPLEAAQAFRQLADEFGLTQDQIARRVGRSRAGIANTLRLLTLEEDIRVSLTSGQITEGHARALLAIDDAAVRLDAWRSIVADALTVRRAEELARALNASPKSHVAKRRRTKAQDPNIAAIESDLRHALGARVSLIKSRQGGRLIIRFHTDEELDGIIERLKA